MIHKDFLKKKLIVIIIWEKIDIFTDKKKLFLASVFSTSSFSYLNSFVIISTEFGISIVHYLKFEEKKFDPLII